MDIDSLLKLMLDKGASDLHIKVPCPPVLRIDGELVRQENEPPVMPQDVRDVFEQIANQQQRDAFLAECELDFAYSIPGVARFRVSVMQQRGTMSLVFRMVPFQVPSIDELGLPPVCKELILKPRGLILITGAVGTGKSTTLAAMINHLNENSSRNVITIEDPIEFLFSDKKCLIRQRDLGDDTKSLPAALRHALRHDPDVIVVGEMRDLDTISTAITAAETGHLVLGTLHTVDVTQTVDRIIDVFSPAQQHQVRLQLAQVIEAVLSQTLVSCIGGGRTAALEIMIANSTIRKLIREERLLELSANIALSSQEGMQTLNKALADLVSRDVIAREEAVSKTSDPVDLNRLLLRSLSGVSQQSDDS